MDQEDKLAAEQLASRGAFDVGVSGRGMPALPRHMDYVGETAWSARRDPTWYPPDAGLSSVM